MGREIDTVQTVGVVGLGTMGAGIVEVLARFGLTVIGVERDEDMLAVGRDHLDRSTSRAVDRGKLAADERDALLRRVTLSTDLADLADCHLVVEAVPERPELKRDLFGRLDRIVEPAAILATNTSSLSVTEIGAATGRPNRVVGMHFFNPAPVQPLVEVVRTLTTDASVVDDIVALAKRMGKVPVVCGDRAGFVTNALLLGYLNHAAHLFDRRYASREGIDAAIQVGYGFPMGPLALLDLIGLDTAYHVLETMYAQSRSTRHAPAPVLREMVTAGWYGRKSGRGFYTYREAGSSVVVDDGLTPAAAAPQPDRDVRTVAVVGSAAVADSLVSAGVEVLTVSADDMDRAKGCDLVVVETESTASMPVTNFVAATRQEELDDIVGVHPVGSDVFEVIPAPTTSGSAVIAAADLCRQAGKAVVHAPDRVGFIADALIFPYLNDAIAMLDAGYATVDDIDTAMKLGCNLPSGPFEMLEAKGPDVVMAALDQLYEQEREPWLAPAPLLRQAVRAGRGLR